MRIDDRQLEKLLREEYEFYLERMKIWADIAEKELASEEIPRECVYFITFETEKNLSYRTRFLNKDATDLEMDSLFLAYKLSVRIQNALGLYDQTHFFKWWESSYSRNDPPN